MPLILNDRVRETSATTGTGSLTLGGAAVGFTTFSSAIGDANTTYYTILDSELNPTYWEVGLGTYSSLNNSLSRDTVYSSSNGNARVVIPSGAISFVFCDYPASRSIYRDKLRAGTGITLTDDVVNNQVVIAASNTGSVTDVNITEPSWRSVAKTTNAGVVNFVITDRTEDGRNVFSGVGATEPMIFQAGAALNPESDGTATLAFSLDPGLSILGFAAAATFTVPSGETWSQVALTMAQTFFSSTYWMVSYGALNNTLDIQYIGTQNPILATTGSTNITLQFAGGWTPTVGFSISSINSTVGAPAFKPLTSLQVQQSISGTPIANQVVGWDGTNNRLAWQSGGGSASIDQVVTTATPFTLLNGLVSGSPTGMVAGDVTATFPVNSRLQLGPNGSNNQILIVTAVSFSGGNTSITWSPGLAAAVPAGTVLYTVALNNVTSLEPGNNITFSNQNGNLTINAASMQQFSDTVGNQVTTILGAITAGTGLVSLSGDWRPNFPAGTNIGFLPDPNGVNVRYRVVANPIFTGGLTDFQITPSVTLAIPSGTGIAIVSRTPYTDVVAGTGITFANANNILTIGNSNPTPTQINNLGAGSYQLLAGQNAAISNNPATRAITISSTGGGGGSIGEVIAFNTSAINNNYSNIIYSAGRATATNPADQNNEWTVQISAQLAISTNSRVISGGVAGQGYLFGGQQVSHAVSSWAAGEQRFTAGVSGTWNQDGGMQILSPEFRRVGGVYDSNPATGLSYTVVAGTAPVVGVLTYTYNYNSVALFGSTGPAPTVGMAVLISSSSGYDGLYQLSAVTISGANATVSINVNAITPASGTLSSFVYQDQFAAYTTSSSTRATLNPVLPLSVTTAFAPSGNTNVAITAASFGTPYLYFGFWYLPITGLNLATSASYIVRFSQNISVSGTPVQELVVDVPSTTAPTLSLFGVYSGNSAPVVTLGPGTTTAIFYTLGQPTSGTSFGSQVVGPVGNGYLLWVLSANEWIADSFNRGFPNNFTLPQASGGTYAVTYDGFARSSININSISYEQRGVTNWNGRHGLSPVAGGSLTVPALSQVLSIGNQTNNQSIIFNDSSTGGNSLTLRAPTSGYTTSHTWQFPGNPPAIPSLVTYDPSSSSLGYASQFGPGDEIFIWANAAGVPYFTNLSVTAENINGTWSTFTAATLQQATITLANPSTKTIGSEILLRGASASGTVGIVTGILSSANVVSSLRVQRDAGYTSGSTVFWRIIQGSQATANLISSTVTTAASSITLSAAATAGATSITTSAALTQGAYYTFTNSGNDVLYQVTALSGAGNLTATINPALAAAVGAGGTIYNASFTGTAISELVPGPNIFFTVVGNKLQISASGSAALQLPLNVPTASGAQTLQFSAPDANSILIQATSTAGNETLFLRGSGTGGVGIGTNQLNVVPGNALTSGIQGVNAIANNDLATLVQVVAASAGLRPQNVASVITHVSENNLTGTYTNNSGLGSATFTGTAPLIISGVNVANGNTVLLAAQSAQLQNGGYTVTSNPASGTYTLTRLASAISFGNFWVSTATAAGNYGVQYSCTTTDTIVIGTTAIIYSLFGVASPAGATPTLASVLTGGRTATVAQSNNTIFFSDSTQLRLLSAGGSSGWGWLNTGGTVVQQMRSSTLGTISIGSSSASTMTIDAQGDITTPSIGIYDSTFAGLTTFTNRQTTNRNYEFDLAPPSVNNAPMVSSTGGILTFGTSITLGTSTASTIYSNAQIAPSTGNLTVSVAAAASGLTISAGASTNNINLVTAPAASSAVISTTSGALAFSPSSSSTVFSTGSTNPSLTVSTTANGPTLIASGGSIFLGNAGGATLGIATTAGGSTLTQSAGNLTVTLPSAGNFTLGYGAANASLRTTASAANINLTAVGSSASITLQAASGGAIVVDSQLNLNGGLVANNSSGTTGQFLTSRGSGQSPQWTSATVGGTVGSAAGGSSKNADQNIGAGVNTIITWQNNIQTPTGFSFSGGTLTNTSNYIRVVSLAAVLVITSTQATITENDVWFGNVNGVNPGARFAQVVDTSSRAPNGSWIVNLSAIVTLAAAGGASGSSTVACWGWCNNGGNLIIRSTQSLFGIEGSRLTMAVLN